MLSQFIYMYLNTNKYKCSFTVNEPVSKEQWNSLTHTGVVNVIYTFCGESDALIVPSGFYPNPSSAMEHNRSPLVLSWPYCLIVICTNILFSWFSFAVSLYYCFVDNSCLIYVFMCCLSLCACIAESMYLFILLQMTINLPTWVSWLAILSANVLQPLGGILSW